MQGGREMMRLRYDRCSTLSMALLRERSIRGVSRSISIFRRKNLTRSSEEDWYRNWKIAQRRRREVEKKAEATATSRGGNRSGISNVSVKLKIVLHNFRLASRSEELQLLSSSTLRGISLTPLATLSRAPRVCRAFPRRRSHSVKGEFRSARILKGSLPERRRRLALFAPVISKCI